MKFKKIIKPLKPLLLTIPTALTIFLARPQLAKPQEQIDVSFMQVPDRDIPAYNVAYFNDSLNVNLYVDGQTTSLDVDEKLKRNPFRTNLEQKIGAKLFLDSNPIWTTTTLGAKYGITLNPGSLPFLKNELKTFGGYQHFVSVKEEMYKAGQLFLGGEENLTGIIKRERGNLEGKFEATGTLGGYGSFVHKNIMWDNYKTGLKLIGAVSVRDLLMFSVNLDQTKTKFNTEKYFFVDDLKETNYGIGFSLHPFFEDIGFTIFLNKNIKKGEELINKTTSVGASVDFEDIGTTMKMMASMSNEESNLILSGSKSLFDKQGSIEIFFNLGSSDKGKDNIYGLRVIKYLGLQNKKERLIINPNDYDKRIFSLIKEQGYKKPNEDFEKSVKEANTLTKIITGDYVYGPGTTPARNPLQLHEDGYGDCNELSWDRTYKARTNGFDKSWDVSYYGESPIGHAFFLVQDKDGRVYATDNDHGVTFRIKVDKNATKEEMANATVKQLSNYLALPLEEGELYFWQIMEPDLENIENRYVVGEFEDWKEFKSEDLGSVSHYLDTGLGSRTNLEHFYKKLF